VVGSNSVVVVLVVLALFGIHVVCAGALCLYTDTPLQRWVLSKRSVDDEKDIVALPLARPKSLDCKHEPEIVDARLHSKRIDATETSLSPVFQESPGEESSVLESDWGNGGEVPSYDGTLHIEEPGSFFAFDLNNSRASVGHLHALSDEPSLERCDVLVTTSPSQLALRSAADAYGAERLRSFTGSSISQVPRLMVGNQNVPLSFMPPPPKGPRRGAPPELPPLPRPMPAILNIGEPPAREDVLEICSSSCPPPRLALWRSALD